MADFHNKTGTVKADIHDLVPHIEKIRQDFLSSALVAAHIDAECSLDRIRLGTDHWAVQELRPCLLDPVRDGN